jgi:arylsulfatase B
MSTPEHTPRGRGFGEGLCYFDHQVEYWTYRPQSAYDYSGHSGPGPCSPNTTLRDLWDHSLQAPAQSQAHTGEYEETMMAQAAATMLRTHASTTPLFLYYAFHAVRRLCTLVTLYRQ